MPTIPTLQPGQVNGIELPGVRVSSDAFGAGNAQALGSIGKGVASVGIAGIDKGFEIAEQRLDLADKVVARNAYNQFRSNLNNTYYNKVLTLKGLDAASAPQTFDQDAGKFMQDAVKGLTPRQQQYFQASADHAILSFQDRIDSHRAKQLDEANKNSLLGENKVVTDDAIRDGRPEALKDAEWTITQNLKSKNAGQDPAFTQSEINSAVHNLYSRRVDSLLAQDPSRAGIEIEQYKDKLDPVWYSETKKKVDAAMVQKLDQDTADKFYYEGIQNGKSRDDILKAIDKAYEKYKSRGNDIAKLVNTKWAQQDAARKYDQQVREGQEWNNLFQNPNYKIPFDLDPATRKGMEDWREKEIKRAAGQDIPTDRAVLHSLTLMGNDDFSKVNLLDYSKYLSPSDFKEMVKRQQDVRTGNTGKADRFRTINQQVNERVKGLSIFDTSSKSESTRKENSVRLSHFYEQFDQKLQQVPQDERNEKKVTEIINGLLKPVHEGGLFSSTKYAFDMPYDIKLQNEQTPPSILKGKPGIQYDAEKDVWYLPKGEGLRGVYDSKGNFLQDQRARKVQSSAPAVAPTASADKPAQPDTNAVKLDDNLLNFVKEKEGLNLHAYSDYRQNSIGYGTRAKSPDEKITKEEAHSRLVSELSDSQKSVMTALRSKGFNFNQDQLNALTSFDYNTGEGANIVNASKSIEEVGNKILAYRKPGELAKSKGLLKRRIEEAQMFNKDALPTK